MKKIIGYYRKCDLLTMFGTLMSLIGIILLTRHHYTFSIAFLVISGICDAFDGVLARKGNYSQMQKTYGGQLDSLSDVICFGVFPSLIVMYFYSNWYTYIICAFYLLCGVIRLAYFNTLDVLKTGKENTFVGVPITTVSIVLPLVFVITRLINFNLLRITLPITLLILGIAFIVGFEYPKPNVPKIFSKILNSYVVNLVILPLLLIFGSDVAFKMNFYGLFEAFSMSSNTLMSFFLPTIVLYVIFLLIYLIILCIFGKNNVPRFTIIILICLLVLINDIKFHIMGNPVELSDVNYLNPDNIGMMGQSAGSIGSWIFVSIIKTVVLAAVSILISLKKIVFKNFNLKKRLIGLALFIATFIGTILLLLHNSIYVMDNIYKISFVKINNYNSNAAIYKEVGFWQGMLYNAITKITVEPEGYNKSEVQSLLDSYSDKEKNIWGKANVVFLLSESFSDLNNIQSTKFNTDLMPNIRSYENDKDKMVFDFISPTHGGGSVNTEFEILTGASINFFVFGYIPYTQYYNDFNGRFAPNLIKEFNNNGYETIYLTPWGSTSFKSSYVYGLFGVDRKIYGNELKGEKKGTYYSDKSLMEDIFNELKDTSEGNYKFIMAATGQNHYPFTGKKYDTYDVSIVESTLNEERQNVILNYAQGIYDADKELNNLYKMIKTLDTPTIVIFYGDHLPFAGDSGGYDAYYEDSYFKTDDKLINNLRNYTTKAVILANFDLVTEPIKMINANYLGAYVINNMDLKISNYFKYIADLGTKMPVFNRISVMVNDKLLSFEEAPEESNLLKTFRYVQYNALYDYEK